MVFMTDVKVNPILEFTFARRAMAWSTWFRFVIITQLFKNHIGEEDQNDDLLHFQSRDDSAGFE